jgi:hypothetical protein
MSFASEKELLDAFEKEIEEDDPDEDRTLFERFDPADRPLLAQHLLAQRNALSDAPDRRFEPYAEEALRYVNAEAAADLAEEVERATGFDSTRPRNASNSLLLAYAWEVATRGGPRRAARVRRIFDVERMTQTEVSVRLAHFLVREEIATGDVRIALSGREVTRHRHVVFHFGEYFRDHSGRYDGAPADSYARYTVDGATHGILVTRDRGQGSVTCEIGGGARLVVHAWPGPLAPLGDRREEYYLRGVIGSALLNVRVPPGDLLAVALPRSRKMRILAAGLRESPRFAATGMSILLIDTAGGVDGYPLPPRYEPPGL